MGTWASPFDVTNAKLFADLLSDERPILPEHAMTRFGNIVGDDRLFDEADALSKSTGPEAWVDFRAHAAAWVAGWLTEGDWHWNKKWDPEAVDICNTAIDLWNETHEAPTWLTLDIEEQFDADPDIGRRPAAP